MSLQIVLLPGDGVGPEVIEAARRVLDHVCERFRHRLNFSEHLFGGAAIDHCGNPLPDDTRTACLAADAVLLGAVGGPKWETGIVRPEAGLLDLRKEMNVFANLRPIRIYETLIDHSPLRTVTPQTDFLIVRELTGGIYFGEHIEGDEIASDVCTYSRFEVERIARIAFEAARGRKKRLVSVDKANVLASSRLWRRCVNELHQKEFSDIALDHILVDAMAMKLIQTPDAFDVILTENMFGDILSDEASVIAGSIGLAPSASIGTGRGGLFEPIHGSAPDIAGKNLANPVGAIASAAMMLRFALNLPRPAAVIERAIEKTIASGALTRDLGGKLGCQEMAAAIIERITD